MAESSSQQLTAAADLLIERNKEEPALSKESPSKALSVTMTKEGPDLGAKVLSSNGSADRPLPAKVPEEEATPTPPESSPSVSENETLTIVTTEEENLSALLKHIKRHGGPDRGEPGKRSQTRTPF